MVFTVSDFSDLKQILTEHPEWRVELRHLLLSEDFEALPGIVRELAEAQRRHEERLAGVEERLARAEDRLAQVEDRLARVEDRLERVENRLERVEDRLGGLQGRTLEVLYRQRVQAYLGLRLRRTEVVDTNDLMDRLEAHLSPDELHEVLLTDIVLRGRGAHLPARPETWLAVEVSSVVDRHDVARAVRRAELLRRAGLPAVPVVAGENATEGAEEEARNRSVAMLQDGTVLLWDEALAAWPV
jgi:uncharacterized coiled-coil protein SlyX